MADTMPDKLRRFYEYCNEQGIHIWQGANGGIVLTLGHDGDEDEIVVDLFGRKGAHAHWYDESAKSVFFDARHKLREAKIPDPFDD